MKKFLAVLLSCLMIFVGLSSGASAAEITTGNEMATVLEENGNENEEELPPVPGEFEDYEEVITGTVNAVVGVMKVVGVVLMVVVMILQAVVDAFMENDENGSKDRAISVLGQVIDMMSRFSTAFTEFDINKSDADTDEEESESNIIEIETGIDADAAA